MWDYVKYPRYQKGDNVWIPSAFTDGEEINNRLGCIKSIHRGWVSDKNRHRGYREDLLYGVIWHNRRNNFTKLYKIWEDDLLPAEQGINEALPSRLSAGTIISFRDGTDNRVQHGIIRRGWLTKMYGWRYWVDYVRRDGSYGGSHVYSNYDVIISGCDIVAHNCTSDEEGG